MIGQGHSVKLDVRILAFACLFTITIHCLPASARLSLTSESTVRDPKDIYGALMLRELPRQAILIGALHEGGLLVGDATLIPGTLPRADDKQIRIIRKLAPRANKLTVEIDDEFDKALAGTDVQTKFYAQDTPDYDDLAGKIEELARKEWLPTLLPLDGKRGEPIRWDPKQAEVPGSAARLATIDFHNAFLIARATHRAIADSGESPARLAVLVRAYANLGESTRHLYSGQSAAMFARSLIYARRLTRLAPDDPLAWWSAGYANALYGTHPAAEAALKRAAELAKAAGEPSWIAPTRDLLACKTPDLVAKSKGADGALASYFAWLTVEDSTLKSLCINFARAALDQNPGAVRALDAISENSGVGVLHETTKQAPVTLNRMLAELGHDALVDKPVSAQTARAISQQFSVTAIIELLAALDHQPDERGQPLPWNVYASVVRECQFVNAMRRIYFVSEQWGVPTESEFAQWWPVVEHHRYAPVFELFRSTGEATAAAKAAVAAIPFQDDTDAAELLTTAIGAKRAIFPAPNSPSWRQRHDVQEDNAAPSLAYYLKRETATETKTGLQMRGWYAKRLFAVNANHPVGIAEKLLLDEQFAKAKIDEVDHAQTSNPIVDFALGKAYRKAGRFDDASRVLTRAEALAPDLRVFKELADISLAQKDEDGWVRVWDRYIAVAEDIGLGHASASRTIAERLAWRGKNGEALGYAQRAADSGSEWGLAVYAQCLSRVGQYDKAAATYEADYERYHHPMEYYYWCRTTGRGHVDKVREPYRAIVEKFKDKDSVNARAYATFLYAEGKRDEACDAFARAATMEHSARASLSAAAARLMQKRPDDARAILEYGSSEKLAPEDIRYVYLLGLKEMVRCMKDPTATPTLQGELAECFSSFDKQGQRPNIAYAFGTLCQSRGKVDQAKEWYHKALESIEFEVGGKLMAAEELRKLGEQPFK